MTQDISNPLQGISYTQQDFSAMYAELLDLVKQLTYKWDPSISDESDPGVILLKLSALIGDKLNYNIDKSILEAFPLSVTQESNARQLYEQLGYYMDWYKSATVPVYLSWIDADSLGNGDTYTIPKFTMVTDVDNTVVYSLLGTRDANGIVISDGLLSTDGNAIEMVAMEGIATQYSVAGETTITPQMVDEDNRLYFSSGDVAQNGVFIKNVNQNNYSNWKLVDNIYEQSYDELRYKFGIDSSQNLCYIEFPDNYAQLIGQGIEITYIRTSGAAGNIPGQVLTKFLADISPQENTKVILNTSNTKIINYAPATDGLDKESLNEAYDNFQKQVGTFKTLITLRDYFNYITRREFNICSNAFVCDRTNDIQSTYKIIGKEKDIDSLTTIVEEAPIDDTEIVQPLLTPFSLKFYLLQSAIALNNKTAFNETFDMDYQNDYINALLADTSHLEHTYEDILPIGKNTYKATSDTSVSESKAYYKYDQDLDTYKLVTIIPDAYYAEILEYNEEIIYDFDEYCIHNNVAYKCLADETTGAWDSTLWEATTPAEAGWYEHKEIINPRALGWRNRVGGSGTEDDPYIYRLTDDETVRPGVTYYKWYSTVGKAGWEVVDLSEYSSDSYVVTADDEVIPDKLYYYYKVFDEVTNPYNPAAEGLYEVDEEALLPHIAFFKNKYPLAMNISTYDPVDTYTRANILSNILSALYNYVNSSQIAFGDKISIDYLTKIITESDTRIKSVYIDDIQYEAYGIYYDDSDPDDTGFKEVKLDTSLDTYQEANVRDQESIYANLFEKDIIAKSILAGTTQLLVNDSEFAYHLNQKYKGKYNNIYAITSEAVIDINSHSDMYTYNAADDLSFVKKNCVLEPNEELVLFRPSLKNIQEFSNGIRYEYILNKTVKSDESYMLGPGEYFIAYNPITSDTGEITTFDYYVYTDGCIINPSIKLTGRTNIFSLTNCARSILIDLVSTDNNRTSGTLSSNEYIAELKTSSAISSSALTSSDSINIQELSQVNIKQEDGYKFYWVLNTPTYSNNNNLKTYKLFESYDPASPYDLAEGKNKYTLKAGEYFFYTNEKNTTLGVLGQGTTIFRDCGVTAGAYTIETLPDIQGLISTDENKVGVIYFEAITNATSLIDNNPLKSGLYERSGAGTSASPYSYSRSLDTEVDPSTNYFILKMNPHHNWYKVNEDSENPYRLDTTENSFSEVTGYIKSVSTINDVSPIDNNWYEIISGVKDVYSDGSSKTRYAESLDRTIVEPYPFDLGDSANYPETVRYEDKSTEFNPALNNWNLFDVAPILDLTGNPKANGWYEKVSTNSNAYMLSLDETVDETKTYYSGSYSSVPYQTLFSQIEFPNRSLSYEDRLGQINSASPKDNNWYQKQANVFVKSQKGLPSEISDRIDSSLLSLAPIPVSLRTEVIQYDEAHPGNYIDLSIDEVVTSEAERVYKTPWYVWVEADEDEGTDAHFEAVESGVKPDSTKTYYTYHGVQFYQLDQYYKYTDKNYYKLNQYVTKIFDEVPAWSCPALDLEVVYNDPIGSIGSYWQSLQLNCDLEITENELISFGEGDLIMFQSSQNLPQGAWPIFRNKEIELDLDSYSISYQKSGESVQQLPAVQFKSMNWNGYSNLLLNASPTISQTLLTNHSLTLYDENGEQIGEPLTSTYNTVTQESDIVTIELMYPEINISGEFIPVYEYNLLGDKLPNALYAFNQIPSTESVKYLDTYKTAISYDAAHWERTIPANLASGDYLLSFTGKGNNNNITVELLTHFADYPEIPVDSRVESIPLHSYSDKTLTEFNEKKNYYVELNIEPYWEIYEASDVWAAIKAVTPGATPASLGWYEKFIDEDGEVSYEETLDETVQSKTYCVEYTKVVKDLKITVPCAEAYTFTLNDIYKYINNPKFSDELFESLYDKICRLDKEHAYNYTYIPGVDSYIEDPIKAKSFWEPNHIHNKFTIAQLDVDNISAKFITNKEA